MANKYKAYSQFVNYLISDDAKSKPYEGLMILFFSGMAYETFVPEKDGYTLSFERTAENEIKVAGKTAVHFDEPSITSLANVQLKTFSESTDEGSLNLYEEAYNEPCSAHIENSEMVQMYIQKRRYETGTDDTSLDSTFGFKTQFDIDEYFKWDVPTTEMNGDIAYMTADDVTMYSDNYRMSTGALIGVNKGDKFIPIGFIDFKRPMLTYKIGFRWNTNGIIKLS